MGNAPWQGAVMAKMNNEVVYRLILVHAINRPFLGILWESSLFMDPMLHFGLHLAPKGFNTVADAIQWHVQREEVDHVNHYLDGFIVLGPRGHLIASKL